MGCRLGTLKDPDQQSSGSAQRLQKRNEVGGDMALIIQKRDEVGGDMALITPSLEILFLKWLPSPQEEKEAHQWRPKLSLSLTGPL